jgi:aspartyl protease family protein
MRRGQSLSVAFAAFVCSAAMVASDASATSAEVVADARGHFITTAEIEHTPITVLVDTGASFVALSYEDAEQAGLAPRTLTYDVPINTANGRVDAARVVLDRVEIGNVLVRDVEGIVLPRGTYEGTLLGMSFLNKLSRFKVENGTLFLDE